MILAVKFMIAKFTIFSDSKQQLSTNRQNRPLNTDNWPPAKVCLLNLSV
jgi:hypothetical protein